MTVYTRNRQLTVNSVNLSAYLVGLEVVSSTSTQDTTKTGSGNRTYGAGLPDYTVEAEFEQDRSAGAVHLTLQPLLGVATAVSAKPDDGEVFEYAGSMILTSYTPIVGGDADNVERFTASFVPAGDITITNA